MRWLRFNKATKVLALLMSIVFIALGTGINNVMAFYTVDKNGNSKEPSRTQIVVTFHYGDGTTWEQNLTPEVDGNKSIAIYDDEVAYIKEYTLPHRDDNPIVSVSITYPKVTHSADDESDHVRMYWVGTYTDTIKGIYDGWHNELTGGTSGAYGVWNVKPGADGEVNWYDFKGKCNPVVDNDRSVQTWATVPGDQNTEETRTFTFSAEDGGKQFVYFVEGTTYTGDEKFHQKDKGRDGYRPYYGTHISGIIGIVFNYSIRFDLSSCPECGKAGTTVQRSVPVYYDSYSAASVSGIAGAELAEHNFKGWYDQNGIPVYDTSGNAVLTYTDASGKEQSSPYWKKNADGETVWGIEDNLTVYARYDEDVYTVHYERGESCSDRAMPADDIFTLGTAGKLASGKNVQGSDYTLSFETQTGTGSTYASVIQPKTGFFKFKSWGIEGKDYISGASYIKADAVRHEVVDAVAQYHDMEFILPDAKRSGYVLDGWYEEYDASTETFSAYAGAPGDKYILKTSPVSVDVTLYAKWRGADVTLRFDYNVPDKALTSPLGYVLSGDEEKERTVKYDDVIGTLPSPALTGYRLKLWSWYKDFDVAVYGDTVYDGTSDVLYAKWQPLKYKIVYDYDGGAAGYNPQSAEYYDELTINSPTKEGCALLGWEVTGMDGYKHILDGGISYDGEAFISAVTDSGTEKVSVNVSGLRADDGTVYFKAVWEDKEYKITYDYDGGNDPGNPVTYTVNTPTFSLIKPEKQGYTFMAWSGTDITDKMPSVTIVQGSRGDRFYKAHYEAVSYNIKYRLEGGEWVDTAHPGTVHFDEVFGVGVPVLSGCTFLGWDITGMDDCTHYIGAMEYTGNEMENVTAQIFKNLRSSYGTVVFTAKWSDSPYSIEYDFNGGDAFAGGSYPDTAYTWTEFNVSNPVRSGYTFAGWTITGMDNGTHYIGGTSCEDTAVSGIGRGLADGADVSCMNLRHSVGTVKFTAAWETDTRQVVFFSNGGTMTGESVHDGWTLRNIRFGASAFHAADSYGVSWGTDVPKVSRTGYAFDGYFDSLADGNAAYDKGFSKAEGLYWADDGTWIGPSLILYAHFTPNGYKVRYDVNGGAWISDGSDDDRMLGVIYDSTLNNKAYGSTDVYRQGYIFLYWQDENGNMVYNADGECTDEGGYWSQAYIKGGVK